MHKKGIDFLLFVKIMMFILGILKERKEKGRSLVGLLAGSDPQVIQLLLHSATVEPLLRQFLHVELPLFTAPLGK
jgi:hypothetical protein